MVVLLFARVWARARELLLPLGFFLLLASTAPQFASYIALVQLLDQSLDTPPTLTVGAVLTPTGYAVLTHTPPPAEDAAIQDATPLLPLQSLLFAAGILGSPGAPV